MQATGVGGAWTTALRARQLTATRHDAFRQLLQEADAIVAVCEWVRSLLLRAGAPATKLMMSRQGTAVSGRRWPSERTAADRLRMAYVGRLHPTKGLHVALGALRAELDLPVALDVFGIVQDADGNQYLDALRALSRDDPRVQFHAPIGTDDVVPALAGYDCTIVPSQWLETGPLTVLESFAAGVPVVGSNLGGIAELVTHDRDGWLVPHADQHAWRTAFRRLAADRSLIDRLRAGVRPPRSTDDVARDMLSVYEAVVARPSASKVGVA
jgi:glycosyltransferase involved in cell wall biosynthesis